MAQSGPRLRAYIPFPTEERCQNPSPLPWLEEYIVKRIVKRENFRFEAWKY